jgi:hypothetical protein
MPWRGASDGDGRAPLPGKFGGAETTIVSNIDQTRFPIVRYIGAPSRSMWGVLMYTSAECRAQAEEKLAQAEHDNQHQNRLIPPLKLGFSSQIN